MVHRWPPCHSEAMADTQDVVSDFRGTGMLGNLEHPLEQRSMVSLMVLRIRVKKMQRGLFKIKDFYTDSSLS